MERYWTSGFDFAAQLKTASSPLKKRISRRSPSATAVNKTPHVNLDQQTASKMLSGIQVESYLKLQDKRRIARSTAWFWE